MDKPEMKGPKAVTDDAGLEQHERQRHSGQLETPSPGTAAGVDFQDERRSLRYVGGGPNGGQNWANEGFGANQSYSAGDGYATAPAHEGTEPEGEKTEYAVSPADLGINPEDLQGGYGLPQDAEAHPRESRKP